MRNIIVAYGDGIGPEIMDATLYVLKEAKAKISIASIQIGQQLYNKHYTSGIDQMAWDTIAKGDVLLKAPITTPQGGGYKSLNVTLRKSLGLYANIRPAKSFAPFVWTLHPNLDVVIIRENEEDIYAGIEYRHTHNVYESIKLISQTGSQKIIRYAFEYARSQGRKKVTCVVKDNIMKFTDGIFHKIFNEVALEYQDIESNSILVDIGIAKIATKPENFDVIVTSNLYGDIISDLVAEISGSVGLAGSANIGQNYAMFEAVHGSAPDIAGLGIANPSGLLNAAIMMLAHIDQPDCASLIDNALKKTIEDGIHTADIYNPQNSKAKVSTMEFAYAVGSRLGQQPSLLRKTQYQLSANLSTKEQATIDTSEVKKLVGADVFINTIINNPDELAQKILSIGDKNFKLISIAHKGLKVWPDHANAHIIGDHWCCRFMGNNEDLTHQNTAQLLALLADQGIDFIKIEHLYTFNNHSGYSLSQGE